MFDSYIVTVILCRRGDVVCIYARDSRFYQTPRDAILANSVALVCSSSSRHKHLTYITMVSLRKKVGVFKYNLTKKQRTKQSRPNAYAMRHLTVNRLAWEDNYIDSR